MHSCLESIVKARSHILSLSSILDPSLSSLADSDCLALSFSSPHPTPMSPFPPPFPPLSPALAPTPFAIIILNRVDLSELEAEASLDFLLNDFDEALIGAFLVLMRAKGETYEEVVGLEKAMLKHALKVEGLVDAVDIVGTSGDGANTVKISIGASILAAACGAKVAKQGSRSSSSACGSVDVLEEMGVVIDLEPEGVTRCVNEVGIGFMMAPIYHPAMKAVRPVRKKLKVKTVFNVLGPMLNPTRVPYTVVGVYIEDLVLKMAKALQRFGMKRALIVDSFEFDYGLPCRISGLSHISTSFNHEDRYLDVFGDGLSHRISGCLLVLRQIHLNYRNINLLLKLKQIYNISSFIFPLAINSHKQL
ncbi:hypothetical protein UlMin_022950 [Ulmus minor]